MKIVQVHNPKETIYDIPYAYWAKNLDEPSFEEPQRRVQKYCGQPA